MRIGQSRDRSFLRIAGELVAFDRFFTPGVVDLAAFLILRKIRDRGGPVIVVTQRHRFTVA